MADELSPALVSFVREHVQSIELLEVMLHVCAHRDRAWTADDVATELRIQPRSARARLDHLARIGVARVDGDAFRCNPDSAYVAVIDELASAYQTRRLRIIDLVFSKPADNVRVFADAFVIGAKGKKP